MSPSNPPHDEEIREPDNSTVDDWLGQRVDRDEELAERVLEESGGDAAEAERRFDEESEAEEWDQVHVQDTDAAGEPVVDGMPDDHSS